MSLDCSLRARIRSIVYACARMHLYLRARTRMHLDPREFAAFKRINANAVSCVRLRACSRAGLIKTQNAFVRKNRKTQTHFGFRNFQDVLYIYNIISYKCI